MRKKLGKRLVLHRESLLRLTPESLSEAKGARPTFDGTCDDFTCPDSCATCYATCVTCGASCTC